MTDIMVDLETTGTKPAYSGILQLAAVKFNLEEQQIGEPFDRCPSLLPNRFWDEGTREFWGTMPAIYGRFVARQEDAEEVLIDSSKWVTKDPDRKRVVWGQSVPVRVDIGGSGI